MTNFIRSAIKYLIACAWLITCEGVWAQEQEFTPLAGEFDFLAVKDIKFYTICSLKYGEPVEWEGKGLHIGIEQFDLDPIPQEMLMQGSQISVRFGLAGEGV